MGFKFCCTIRNACNFAARQSTFAFCESNSVVINIKDANESCEESTSEDNRVRTLASEQGYLGLTEVLASLIDINCNILEWNCKILIIDFEAELLVKFDFITFSIGNPTDSPVLTSHTLHTSHFS